MRRWSFSRSIGDLRDEPLLQWRQIQNRKSLPLNFSWPLPNDYNYTFPTCVNHCVEGTEVAGPFADIRGSLDLDYHGCYTLDRQKLQDVLVNDVIGEGTSHDQPWIVFTAGCMGAGKTHVVRWMSQQGYFPLPDIVQIDPDCFRTELPEWREYLAKNPETAGALTNRESGFLVEIATEASMRAYKHIWVDGSLRDGDWYSGLFSNFRKTHPRYRIAILHIRTSWKVAKTRVMERAVHTGRMVPEAALRDSFDRVPAAVQRLSSLVDFIAHIDNDGIPILAASCGEETGTMNALTSWDQIHDRFATLQELSFTDNGLALLPWIEELVREEPVVVFSKTFSSYCKRAKQLLEDVGAQYHSVEFDTMTFENVPISGSAGAAGVAAQLALGRSTGKNTVPQIFIGGVHVGGYVAVRNLKRQELCALLTAAGVVVTVEENSEPTVAAPQRLRAQTDPTHGLSSIAVEALRPETANSGVSSSSEDAKELSRPATARTDGVSSIVS